MHKDKNGLTVETLYTTHCSLFQHYSTQIFTARVSTITVSVLAIMNSFDAFDLRPLQLDLSATLGILAYGATLLILALWFLEIGYLWKFYRLIELNRQFESECGYQTFFGAYRPHKHILVYVYYTAAIAFLSVRAAHFGFFAGLQYFWLVLVIVFWGVAAIRYWRWTLIGKLSSGAGEQTDDADGATADRGVDRTADR